MYVDAMFDRHRDRILVAERRNGERVLQEYPVPWTLYWEHPAGQHRSIFGHSCKKFSTDDGRKFHGNLKRLRDEGRRIFESDIRPEFRLLAQRYTGADTPVLHVGFFDIEVDFDPAKGFAPPDNPFNAITAITIYLSHVDRLVTLVLKPKTYSVDDADAICRKFDDTILFVDEISLLDAFLDLIDDCDVLTGWNSEGFDIPYVVNRMRRLKRGIDRRLCLWGQQPREREYVKFKKKFITYDLVGRVHLDYLLLYQKHNTQQLHSYRLDYVGEIEVGENKVPYEGTLDDLYKKDFEKFIAYNRQDTMLLVKIDRKRKFIELANQIAHANCVLLKTTMGSVALVETAIINEMHALGFVVPDRKPREEGADDSEPEEALEPDDFWDDEEDEDPSRPRMPASDGKTPVVGAYVAKPKVGLHQFIGAVDINSLYPSTIRALNMSPETIVGQLRPSRTMALIAERIAEGTPRAEAWEGIFASLEYEHMMARDDAEVMVDYDDGRCVAMTGAQLYDYIFDPANHLCITANGTIFRTDKEGIIPALLAKWYAERKQLQKQMKEWAGKEKDAKEAGDAAAAKEAAYWKSFYDQRQLAKKILLNSLYGALLNEGLRFYDQRLGQSTTLTGRSIVQHMNATINRVVTGEYDYRGDAIYYSDTDSSYFSAYAVLKDDPRFAEFEWSRENVVSLYDNIAEETNASFPEFMARRFNTTLERGGIIKAGRELVASNTLFIKKKKYAALCYDVEGVRQDADGKPGKLKAMGLDLKRADTPKYMQAFLNRCLMGLLTGESKETIFEWVREFRREFKEKPGWEKGAPKAVKALSDYGDRERAAEEAAARGRIAVASRKGKKASNKIDMPGHVRAALAWNHLCEVYDDRYSMRIGDGARIIVCKLRPNVLRIDSIAYPIDEPHLPEWFRELPFDHEAMEDAIIDSKLKNLLGVLNWDLDETKDRPGSFSFF